MEQKDNIRLVQVFAGEYWKTSMIKNILEDNDIQVYLENEYMGSIAPWRIEAGGFNPFKVIVSSLDYDAAMKLIEEFNSNDPQEEDNT